MGHLAWKFKAHFCDGSFFLSQDIRHKLQWASEPFPSKIIQLDFFLPITHNGKFQRLVLKGFEKYIVLIEVIDCMSSVSKIESIWIMGKNMNSLVVHVFRIVEGRVEKACVAWGKEFYGTPVIGWKEGFPQSNTVFDMMDV